MVCPCGPVGARAFPGGTRVSNARPSRPALPAVGRAALARLNAAGTTAGGGRWRIALTEQGPRRLAAIGLILLMLASPWPPLTVLALVAYVATTLFEPGLTVALLPLSAPFAYRPKAILGADGPVFPVVELLLLVALLTSGLALARYWRRAAAGGTGAAATLDAWDVARGLVVRPFGTQAAALVLLGALSLLTIADPAHLRESLRELRTVIVEPVAYFFLALFWLRDHTWRRLAVVAFITGAVIVATIGIGQILTGRGVVVAEGVRRATGAHPHPNALAFYLERALPFATALLLFAPGADTPRRRASFVSRLPRSRPLLLACALLGTGTLLTFSRGAYLGVATMLPALAILSSRRTVRFGLAGLAVAGAILLPALAGGRLGPLAAEGGSFELRRLIWGSTLAMIQDYPAFGVGLDQFLYQYAPRYIHPAAWGERFTSHPHNLLLDFWVRLGIMGLAWLGWTLWSMATKLVQAWRAAGEGTEARQILAAVGVACGAALVHGLLDNFYFLIDLAFVWWLFLALIQTAGESDSRAVN